MWKKSQRSDTADLEVSDKEYNWWEKFIPCPWSNVRLIIK